MGSAWQLLGAGIDQRMRDFLLQFVVLAVTFVLLGVLPEAAIRLWVPQQRQELVVATVVSVKNPTVIAMTVLWIVGVGRTLMTAGRPARPGLVG